jgi:hypothetical protein
MCLLERCIVILFYVYVGGRVIVFRRLRASDVVGVKHCPVPCDVLLRCDCSLAEYGNVSYKLYMPYGDDLFSEKQ